jgi:hypothetical protein
LVARRQTLAFIRPGWRLGLVPLSGDHKPVSYLPGEFLKQPAFSPDGRWIADVAEESGRHEVYVQSIPAGRGRPHIYTTGGAQPLWRRDGKEIFYLSPDRKMVGVPVKTDAAFLKNWLTAGRN